jgi:hypothetical protein
MELREPEKLRADCAVGLLPVHRHRPVGRPHHQQNQALTFSTFKTLTLAFKKSREKFIAKKFFINNLIF